jgi:P27 family predicted phage terminase small subunit
VGKRGPLPQSEAERRLKGNPGRRKSKRRVQNDAVLTELPQPPVHLQRIAKYEWRRIGNKLINTGKITGLNLKALELYCVNYAIARENLELLKKEGFVCTSGKGGHKMPHPAVGVMNKAQKESRDWLKILERTPESAPKKASDPMEEFIKSGRKLKSVK